MASLWAHGGHSSHRYHTRVNISHRCGPGRTILTVVGPGYTRVVGVHPVLYPGGRGTPCANTRVVGYPSLVVYTRVVGILLPTMVATHPPGIYALPGPLVGRLPALLSLMCQLDHWAYTGWCAVITLLVTRWTERGLWARREAPLPFRIFLSPGQKQAGFGQETRHRKQCCTRMLGIPQPLQR